ncbi:MAG: 50S ribosomal protein L1 [Candidatus Hermodarchaeota archaeon]
MPIDKKLILKAVEEARKETKKRKFPQTLDLIVNLKDLELKIPENRINELVELPHPPKPKIKLTVFAGGDLAFRAEKAGADRVLTRERIERFASDKKGAKKLIADTDFFLAETSLMATVGKILGPMLGPRGKMPTPVPPTAPIDVIIDRHRKSVRVRIRDQMNTQVGIGTEEMSDETLAENIQAVISLLERRLPKGSRNIQSVSVKTTMGPLKKIGS